MSGGGGRWWSEWGGAARCFRAHLCLPTLAGRGAAAGGGAARGVAARGAAAPAPGGAPCFFRPAAVWVLHVVAGLTQVLQKYNKLLIDW